MQQNIMKEVYFEQYCKLCRFESIPEDQDPCENCLNNPVNLYSHKPVEFKEQ